MFLETKTLIVVYKDELMLNQLKKLIETKDDSETDGVVGVTDESVRIVAWTEKVWRDQKKAGNINNKVLFLGDIKDTDKLIPIIDIKYDQYGITYGWAGNQAILYVDPKALAQENIYNEFIEKLSAYSPPDILKANPKQIDDCQFENLATTEASPIKEQTVDETRKKKSELFLKLGSIVGVAARSVSKTASAMLKKVQTDWEKIRKQQLYYGIMKLYENDLESFIQG